MLQLQDVAPVAQCLDLGGLFLPAAAPHWTMRVPQQRVLHRMLQQVLQPQWSQVISEMSPRADH